MSASPITDTHANKAPTFSLLSNEMVIEITETAVIKEPDRKIRPPSKRATATAQAMLEQWGQVIPLVVEDDGAIIFGYEFLLAARALGWKTIKIIRLSNLSREHARVLSIALARLPELSSWDNEILAVEFEDLLGLDLGFDIYDLSGFTIGEMDVIIDPDAASDIPNPLDEVPEPSPTEETVTWPGDIWLLGPHRIVCGNSLEAVTYDRLMGKKLARMVLADGPYGIAIKGNVSGLGKTTHENFAMGVGEMSFSEFVIFLKTWLTHSVAHLVDGGLCYCFMDRRHLEELHIAGRETGLRLFDLAFWNKLTGGMGSYYRSQHEPCVIFKHGTAPHRNNIELGKNGRYRTNVWDHRGYSSFGRERDEALKSHPTVKPCNLLAEAIKDCTKRGEIVLDGFLGSGTTIIAAEKTGRIGFGIELEPKYVDVSVKRWEKMTGKQAVHEATGFTFAQLRGRRLRNAPKLQSP
ncbi:MAG: DNA methyltransferase [Nitrospirales bacterium]